MIISKEICFEEVRADGLAPVIIKVSHLGKIYSLPTSIYIKERNWDRIGSAVTDGDPDYKLKNEMIDGTYRRISGKIQNFLDETLDRSLRHLVSNEDDNCRPESLTDLIRMKIQSVLALNTRRGYASLLRYVEKRFGSGLTVSVLDQEFTNRFIEAVESDFTGKPATKRLMFSRFNAVIGYGREAGLIRNSLKIALPHCGVIHGERNLDVREIRCIFNVFKDIMSNDLELYSPDSLALGIFVLDVAFQGLAPVDLASLRVKDLQYRTLSSPGGSVEEIKTVEIRTARKKTGRAVHIISALTGIEKLLTALTRNKAQDDYLIPCFNRNISYSPAQRQNRLANFFNRMARYLNRSLAGTQAGERRITYYCARHAFCNLADSLDVPRHLIQHLVGHRTTVLETNYLRTLTPWEQASISRDILRKCFGEGGRTDRASLREY